jgi:hypothetical protein
MSEAPNEEVVGGRAGRDRGDEYAALDLADGGAALAAAGRALEDADLDAAKPGGDGNEHTGEAEVRAPDKVAIDPAALERCEAQIVPVPAALWACSCGGENLSVAPAAVRELSPQGKRGEILAQCAQCKEWRLVHRKPESRIIVGESMTDAQHRRFRQSRR